MKPVIFLILTFLFNLLPAQNPHSPTKVVLKTYELDSLEQHPLIVAQYERDFSLLKKVITVYVEKKYSRLNATIYCFPSKATDEMKKANEKRLNELVDLLMKRVKVFQKSYIELIMAYTFLDTSYLEISTLLYHNKTQVIVQNHTNLLAENFIKRINTKSGHKEWIGEMKKLYLVFLGLDKVKWIKD